MGGVGSAGGGMRATGAGGGGSSRPTSNFSGAFSGLDDLELGGGSSAGSPGLDKILGPVGDSKAEGQWQQKEQGLSSARAMRESSRQSISASGMGTVGVGGVEGVSLDWGAGASTGSGGVEQPRSPSSAGKAVGWAAQEQGAA